jgi:hypothetical protein
MGVVFPAETGREGGHDRTMNGDELRTYQGKGRLYIFAELRYCDAFGGAHWISRCASRGLKETEWRYCGTATDNNNSKDDGECKQGQPQ